MKKNGFTRRAFSALFAIGVLTLLASCESAADKAVDLEALRGGETRETLSPAYFTGKAARAYKAAKEIPEVLDSLYCYCDCKEGFGHKSLLSCHVDQHSKYCGICMDEAILALEMHNDGKDISEIRTAVDKKFSGRGH